MYSFSLFYNLVYPTNDLNFMFNLLILYYFYKRKELDIKINEEISSFFIIFDDWTTLNIQLIRHSTSRFLLFAICINIAFFRECKR